MELKNIILSLIDKHTFQLDNKTTLNNKKIGNINNIDNNCILSLRYFDDCYIPIIKGNIKLLILNNNTDKIMDDSEIFEKIQNNRTIESIRKKYIFCSIQVIYISVLEINTYEILDLDNFKMFSRNGIRIMNLFISKNWQIKVRLNKIGLDVINERFGFLKSCIGKEKVELITNEVNGLFDILLYLCWDKFWFIELC